MGGRRLLPGAPRAVLRASATRRRAGAPAGRIPRRIPRGARPLGVRRLSGRRSREGVAGARLWAFLAGLAPRAPAAQPGAGAWRAEAVNPDMQALEPLFWIALLVVGYAYAGYGALVYCLVRLQRALSPAAARLP